METLKLKKLASVPSEDSFESSTSKHFIVEDGGELKRLSADAVVSEPFVVTFDYENVTADKTFDEILAAVKAQKTVYAKDDGVDYLPLCFLMEEPSKSCIFGYVEWMTDGSGVQSAYQYSYNVNSWSRIEV